MTVGALALGICSAPVGAVPMHVGTRDVSFAGHRTSWLVPVLGHRADRRPSSRTSPESPRPAAGAKLASFVGLTEVLFAIVFAWLFLGQLPTGSATGRWRASCSAGVALVRADELRAPTA